MKTTQKRNHFGKVAGAYAVYRRDYPDAVYEAIYRAVPSKDAHVLDVGCGTGLAASHLASYYRDVVGTDKEKEMVETAAKNAVGNVRYILAPAEQLPFPDHSLDLITVAQAFHWFDQPQAMKEMCRLLKPQGFVIIFRKQLSDRHKLIADFIYHVVKKYAVIPLGSPIQDDFFTALHAGFRKADRKEILFEDRHSLEEYLGFLKSHSTFILIPIEKQSAYLEEMRKELASRLENNQVVIRGVVEMWFCQP